MTGTRCSYGGRLYNLAHGGAFYSPRVGRVLSAPRRHRLTQVEWSDISATLVAKTDPPIWNEYMMSAHRRINDGDLRGSIIDLAVVAEIVIRRFVDGRLSSGTVKGVRRVVKRINLSDLIDRRTKFELPGLPDDQWLKIKDVFDKRNDIMHRGDHQGVELSVCQDSADAVAKLVEALAKYL
jgi:hypothetical protein